jgi:hypothetical protein
MNSQPCTYERRALPLSIRERKIQMTA